MPFLRKQLTLIFITVMIGLCAGSAAVGFEYLSMWIFHHGLVALSFLPFWVFSLGALSLITGGALITGILMARFAPTAAGSGVPEVEIAYKNHIFDFSWPLILVKFFGGALTIGSGSSLGREGPTIHIGAGLASKINRGKPEDARANALCAGAAAGLAAAFNSPLAGVTMVLEEIASGHQMDKYAARCLLASAISVSMIYFLTGNGPLLPIQETVEMGWKVLWLSPFVALFASLVGIFFQWATLFLRGWFKQSSIPVWIRPAVGGFLGGIFCITAFGMTSRLGGFGLGEADLLAALKHEILWDSAVWLLGAKVLATIVCYAAGGCGGIFAPLIFFGAMSGIVVHGISASSWIELTLHDQIALSLIGMTAALGAVVRAPLTSIIIVMEMTRQVQILPALMVAAVTAVFINRLTFWHNFYHASIHQDHHLSLSSAIES